MSRGLNVKKGEKEEIWLSSMSKAQGYDRRKKNTQNATKNFDYTTIADLFLRTVTWGNDSHAPIWCGLTDLRDPNLPTYHNSRVIKRTHI